MIRRGYPLLDDLPAHRAREAKRRWLKVLSIPWEKAHPSPTKGAFKKALYAIFFCTLQTPRTPHESQTEFKRTPPVIYFTKTQHNGIHITPATVTKLTFTYATTRGKFPEASPKGPRPMHFRALAGQLLKRTLGTRGLASRLTKPENNNPPQKRGKKQQTYKTQLSFTGHIIF